MKGILGNQGFGVELIVHDVMVSVCGTCGFGDFCRCDYVGYAGMWCM